MIPTRLSTPIEIKAAPADEGTFEGYASTYGGPPDAYGDVVAQRAFARSLIEHKAAGSWPALLWAHDQTTPIGVWTDMAEDGVGLRVKGRLTLGTEKGREALALMKDGALALSIGYAPVKATPLPTGGRLLEDVDLVEVSAVALPANRQARIVSVKSLRDVETILRDSGLPRHAAKAIAAGGWQALGGQTPPAYDQEQRAAAIRKAADQIRMMTKGSY